MMALYCDTAELPAICAGTAKMRKIATPTLELAIQLEPKIKAMEEEGEITLRVKHGWVASIGIFVVEVLKKFKAAD